MFANKYFAFEFFHNPPEYSWWKGDILQNIENALDTAIIVMQNGGSTAMAESTFRNMLNGSDDSEVFSTWRLDSAEVSFNDGGPKTIMRPVGNIGANLLRTSEAIQL